MTLTPEQLAQIAEGIDVEFINPLYGIYHLIEHRSKGNTWRELSLHDLAAHIEARHLAEFPGVLRINAERSQSGWWLRAWWEIGRAGTESAGDTYAEALCASYAKWRGERK